MNRIDELAEIANRPQHTPLREAALSELVATAKAGEAEHTAVEDFLHHPASDKQHLHRLICAHVAAEKVGK